MKIIQELGEKSVYKFYIVNIESVKNKVYKSFNFFKKIRDMK